MPAAQERGQSAKGLLKLAWDYPTYSSAKSGSGSVAREMRQALSAEEAFRYIAGNDPRPLLVLRECLVCNGTDDALLSKGTDNEKTFLMSTWFHCVKLPVDVLEKTHPFYEVFGHEDPEHLFVAMPDGTGKVKLQSQTSRTELWDSMEQILDASYKKATEPVVKLIAKQLDRMDILDSKLLDLRAKRNAILESDGARSTKLEKIDAEIVETTDEINALKEEIAKASKLELKSPEPTKVGASLAPSKS